MVKTAEPLLEVPPAEGVGGGSLTRELSRVEEANIAFYEAFKDCNLDAMSKVWSPSPHARCVHPGWELVTGWESIRRSWADIFESIEDLEVTLEDVQVEVVGTIAWVNQVVTLGIATAEDEAFKAQVVTTNIFEKTHGNWQLVLHHSSNFLDEEDGDDDDEGRGHPLFSLRRDDSGSSSMN